MYSCFVIRLYKYFSTVDITEATSSADSNTDNLNSISASQSSVITPKTIDIADTEISSASNGQLITFNESISFNGSGAKVSSSTITISSAGVYTLEGTSSDAAIIIDASKDDDITLVLNGVNLACKNSAAIYVKKAGNVTITLAENTTNTISDGNSYTITLDGEEEAASAIFSKSDLLFNGSGTLNVNGNCNNGITSKDGIKLADGTINVTSNNNGIKGKDYIVCANVCLNISSVGDSLKSSNIDDPSLGYIAIYSGEYSLSSSEDTIQAETELIIDGGTFNLVSGGGSVNAPAHSAENDWKNFWGNSDTSDTETTSTKAIKGGTAVFISNGDFTIDSADDGIHSNGDVSILGGTFNISSGDDGIHADNDTTISGGNISILKSYEGIEGATITFNGGNVAVIASDDGLNASSGSTEMGGRGGFEVDSSAIITINGGIISVNANGDGVDSNGNIIMNGGELYVEGPTNSGNGALDYAGSFTVNGGTAIAIGSTGMAQGVSSDSPQAGIMANVSGKSGDVITILSSDGNVLMTYTANKNFSSVVACCKGMEKDLTYSIQINGGNSVSATAGTSSGGMGGMGGGWGGDRGNRGRDKSNTPENFEGMTPPEGFESMTPPENMGEMTPPDGMTPPNGMERPNGMGEMAPPNETTSLS